MIVTGRLNWSGILKLTIDLEENNLELPTRGLVKNKKMHVTLCHQSIFKLLEYDKKRFDKYLRKNPIKNINKVVEVDIALQTGQIFEEDEKKVLVFFVTEQCQLELDALVQKWFDSYGLKDAFNSIRPNTEDHQRKFHISYANVDGNPGNSIAVVW